MSPQPTRVRLLTKLLRSSDPASVARVLDRMDWPILANLLDQLGPLELRRAARVLLDEQRVVVTVASLSRERLTKLLLSARAEDVATCLATIDARSAASAVAAIGSEQRDRLLAAASEHDRAAILAALPRSLRSRDEVSVALRLRRLFR